MKKLMHPLLLILTLSITPSLVLADEVVATVNGKKIMQSELDEFISNAQKVTGKPIKDKRAALVSLIDKEIMYDAALKKGYDKKKEITFLIEQYKREIYIKALLNDSKVGNKIPDTELKKLYDQQLKAADLQEYKVSHIVTETEAQAKTVVAELDKGSDFKKLAEEKSKGPSAKQGGDIGWVNRKVLQGMPSYVQALSDLKKNTYTKKPIKTNYGWHVIRLDDKRKMEPPPFEKVKPQLASVIRQQRFQEYIQEMRKKSKIDIKLK